jgi:hypothetical protein
VYTWDTPFCETLTNQLDTHGREVTLPWCRGHSSLRQAAGPLPPQAAHLPAAERLVVEVTAPGLQALSLLIFTALPLLDPSALVLNDEAPIAPLRAIHVAALPVLDRTLVRGLGIPPHEALLWNIRAIAPIFTIKFSPRDICSSLRRSQGLCVGREGGHRVGRERDAEDGEQHQGRHVLDDHRVDA